jgi:predicted RNase H-like HicB family nuclease
LPAAKDKKMKKYNVSDGKIVLTLQEDEDGWYTVTSPTDPAMITQAKSIRDAFVAAKDAMAALAGSRADTQRWEKAGRRQMKRPA